jgi:OOP family OmpA-OmpF porin
MAPTIKSLKGFVLTFFFLLILNFSSAAQARIAIVGGVNRSTVLQTSNQPNFSNLKKGYEPRIGFHIGFLADFPLSPTSKFYFQPAIEYFNKGRKFSQSTKNSAGDSVFQTNSFQFLNYIDIPLNIVYKFELAKKIALIVGAGPYLSFFYSGKTNTTVLGPNNYYTSTGDVSNLPTGKDPGQYATIDYGLNALAGIDFGGSFITANFSQGLHNAYRDSTYSGSFKNQVFSVTLGVYLGERKKKKPSNQPDSTADNDCDGIVDKVDFCPTVPGIKKYNGCPVPDSDCDSLNDEQDKCPYLYGPKDNDGCPFPDTDGDSVNDKEDKCPTAKGLPEYKGCPIPIDETLAADSIIGDTMIYVIYYDANKIKINIKGAITVAKLSKLFKAHEDLDIKISGYSDKSNSPKIDKQQSAGRAVTVRNYFKEEDMPASRMKLNYWGSTKASYPRKDTINKWQDRRVEIAVYQKKPDTNLSVDSSTITNPKKTSDTKHQNLIIKKQQTSSYKSFPESTDITTNKHNIKSAHQHTVSTNSSAVTISTNTENHKANKNIIGVNHNSKNKKPATKADQHNAVSYNPNKKTNAAANNIPITAIVPTISASGVITKDNRSLNDINNSLTYQQKNARNSNKNNTTKKSKPSGTKNNSTAVSDTNLSEKSGIENAIEPKTTTTVTSASTATNKLKNKSGTNNNEQNVEAKELSSNQANKTSTNKTNNNSNRNSTSITTATNNSHTNKVNSTADNNQVNSNSLSTVNNSSIAADNNNQKIEKTAAEKLATLDSLIALDKTISKKPSAPIDDTNKVLDCYTIYFDPNQAILNSASFDILDHIREILKLDSSLYIGISGYSEKIGSETSAQKISQERAYLTRDYMNSYGVTLDRMRTSYWGSKIPVANDYDPYQQWENRRVEVCIYIYPK